MLLIKEVLQDTETYLITVLNQFLLEVLLT